MYCLTAIYYFKRNVNYGFIAIILWKAEVNYCLAEANYGLAEANYGLAEANYGLAEANYGLAEANYGLAEVNYGLAEANYGTAEVNYGLAETKDVILFASYWLEYGQNGRKYGFCCEKEGNLGLNCFLEKWVYSAKLRQEITAENCLVAEHQPKKKIKKA